MEDTDIRYDQLLKIHTTGRDDSHSDFMNFPYEPTPYLVLERLANTGYFTKRNVLVDFGCGKGRVDFYLSFMTKCQSIGIEYDSMLFSRAMRNKEEALSRNRTDFVLINAEDYEIPGNADRFYFFNPFCVDILKTVIFRIRMSLRFQPRRVLFFFYYPSVKYTDYLDTLVDFRKIDEIDCMDLYKNPDEREKIIVYEL